MSPSRNSLFVFICLLFHVTVCVHSENRSNLTDLMSVVFMKVDFWQPNSAALIRQNATVDVHVKRDATRVLHEQLKQEQINYG